MSNKLTPIEIGALTTKKFTPRDLSHRTLKVVTLDQEKRPITTATGFLIVGSSGASLYTCWHVVTGIDFFDPVVPRNPRRPAFLQITGIGISITNQSALEYNMIIGPKGQTDVSIGGKYSLEIPLLDDNRIPVWLQESKYHRPNALLNAVGVFVPHFLDVVKIPIQLEPEYAALWGIKPNVHTSKENLDLFSNVLVSGYPYGYSPDKDNLVPIFLKRSVASLSNSQSDVILDIGCSPAMSGAPVWSDDYKLVGIYRGIIFPDFDPNAKGKNDSSAALGLIVPWSAFGDTKNSAFQFARHLLVPPQIDQSP